MPDNLRGKVAVVTGGASGIGGASVEEFVAEGAKVVVADVADEMGNPLADKFRGDATYVHADVTREADVEAAIAVAVERYGRLDVFFNNAGGTGSAASVLDLDEEALQRSFALLINATAYGHKHAGRQFIAQGGGGAIVTTSSVAGLMGGHGSVAYTTAKHALTGIVRQATVELGPLGIRSNLVLPGIIATPMIAKAFAIPPERAAAFVDAVVEGLKDEQPAGRVGSARDIARAAVFLASDMSEFMYGQSVVVDGGMSAVASGRAFQVTQGIATDFS